ncbi:MAG: glycoside hydrolase family 15 protein, partial [Leptospiraceae bacterium]|nr:glycoside hydrolase family 15 protein [Leptospiraceae bacterium]
DCHSSALVGKDGSIDWACFPRFDSPSVFCRVLDADRGGYFQIAPPQYERVEREYLHDTNVLCTRFHTDSGTLEVTDCMPVAPLDPDRPAHVRAYNAILRYVRCVSGHVSVRVVLEPRFEYGSFAPRLRATSDRTVEVVGGADALWLTISHGIRLFDDLHNKERIDWTLTMQSGAEFYIEADWSSSFEERVPQDHPDDVTLAQRLVDTIGFWRQWISGCLYRGSFEKAVRRSALTLKALIYAPTGAVVAAPTTSLPESIGGSRNWDYRYTWIRDSTLTLISMLVLGFRAEADAFRQWVRRTSSGRSQDLQIMYGIDGRRSLPEVELTHLKGHRDSAPVRTGNGAVKQLQLDVYGSMLQAVYIYVRAGGTITQTNWDFLRGLTDLVCRHWQTPDQGIWEIRDEPRHFVHSKLLCWVALDRAIKIAERLNLEAPLDTWTAARNTLYDYLINEAAADGWFPQAVGHDNSPDASTLLVPAMGLLPADHPLVLKTIAQIRERLEEDGLVYRYLNTDGLDGHEGGFLLCSFWLLDALIHSRQLDEAERLLERLLSLENDVGLYAEEAIASTGEALGNFPQAFTHMALVTSCAHLTAARNNQLPAAGTAYDFAEFAMDHLMKMH